ncbi:MAG: hypothetical protein RMY28_012115 [Nostoc sp. ChiSLP01]|nr:hypothetical protein [Nostoc sp. CmiSLP01]MDZ8289225.1 hypothetical protein [Nostoc sp. ChiSLP01]
MAIFIDACFASQNSQIQVEPLSPASFKIIAGHMGDPPSLLALTKAIYGYCPRSWWIKVPGVNFELGQSLSSIAETGVAIALQKITQILDENLNVLF